MKFRKLISVLAIAFAMAFPILMASPQQDLSGLKDGPSRPAQAAGVLASKNKIEKASSKNQFNAVTMKKCSDCRGTGRVDCTYCEGSGHVNCPRCAGIGQFAGKPCYTCGGSGQIRCVTCAGRGKTGCQTCGGLGIVPGDDN